MDFTALTDDQLDQQRRAIIAEQERRKALEDIPEQIAELTSKYLEGGGDPGNLKTS